MHLTLMRYMYIVIEGLTNVALLSHCAESQLLPSLLMLSSLSWPSLSHMSLLTVIVSLAVYHVVVAIGA